MVMMKFNGNSIYIEKAVAKGLDRKIKEIKQKWDNVIVCVGAEGSAKSHLMRQIGAYLSVKQGLPFTVKDNIHFDVKKYVEAAENSPPGTVHILDEARRDLLKSKSTSKSNVFFTNWLSECRNLGLHHIIILPSISDLDKNIVLWRMSSLFNVGTVKDEEGLKQRGFYKLIKTESKKKLSKIYTDKYSKFPSYMTLIRGKFTKIDAIETKEYEIKKKKSRVEKFSEEKAKQEINFGEKELILTENSIVDHRKTYKSTDKDYKTLCRALKKVISLRKTSFETPSSI